MLFGRTFLVKDFVEDGPSMRKPLYAIIVNSYSHIFSDSENKGFSK